jgi:hypothetical protein
MEAQPREARKKSVGPPPGGARRANPAWDDDVTDLVRYVVVKGGAQTIHARQWLRDSGVSELHTDDAIEEAAIRGLLAEGSDRLAPTLRGEQWLLALRAGDHSRASALYLDHATRVENPRHQGCRLAAGEKRAAREAAQAEIRRQRQEQRRAREDRAKELGQTRDQTKRVRGKVTAAAQGRRERIRARAWDRIARADARIAELRDQKAWRAGKAPKRGHGRVWEQNEAVEAEIRHIDPLLVPLWRKHARDFRGTPHERTEAFLEWAEAQSEGDIWDAVEATLPTDAQLARTYEAWAREQGAA